MAELGAVKRKVAELEAKGDTDKAITELEKAIQEFPKEGSLFNKLGDLYIKTSKPKNALEIYEKGALVFKEETYYPNAIALCKKILRLDKDRIEVYQLLGELHKELGQKVEAANYLLEFAERKMQKNELEAALNTYNTVKDLVPNNAKILQTISAIYAQLGKQDQKDKLLQEAHEIETKQRELKDTFAAKAQTEEAVAPPKVEAKPEVEIKPEPEVIPEIKINEPPVVKSTVETPVYKTDEPPPVIPKVEPTADIIIEDKPVKPEVTLDEFVSPEIAELLQGDTAETVNPTAPEVQAAPEKELAKEEEKVPVTLPPKAPEVSEIDKTVELAELYLNLGSEEEAIDCFRNAAEDAFREDQFDKAFALNRRVAALRPLDLKSRQYLIEIAKKQQNTELQINSLLELAEALNRREAKTEAQAVFKKILDLDPNNATAHSMLVEVEQPRDFIDLGEVLRTEIEGEKHSEGIQNINELISQFKKEVFESIGEGDYRSHYDLGVAYKGMSLFQEAIEEFEIASKDPSLKLKTCEMIGSCLIDKNKYDDAIRVLSDGLKIVNHPAKEYFGIHFLLGNAFESMNNLSMALKSYWNAYNIDKSVPDLAKKINELKEKVTNELKKKGARPEPSPPQQQPAAPPKTDAKKAGETEKAAPKKSKVTYL